jgi:hypothetical protein
MLPLRRHVSVLALILIGGCQAVPITPEQLASFSRRYPERTFAIAIPANDLVEMIEHDLANNGIPYTKSRHREEIITDYLLDQSIYGDRRERATAFRFLIAPKQLTAPERTDQGICTMVYVNWDIRSRGLREEEWTTTIEDTYYMPPQYQYIDDRLKQYDSCPRLAYP